MVKQKKAYIAKQPDSHGQVAYSDDENEIWSLLLKKQMAILENRACAEYLQGMELLNLPKDSVPQLAEMNRIFKQYTAWVLEPVPALIPTDTFFAMLARRVFPVATFIRRREDMEYVAEPDIFHEIVGHGPLLMHEPYADFLQLYGQQALRSTAEERVLLDRLFFFTVETGLIRTANGLRIYGGGILSSQAESVYALESAVPDRRRVDINEIIKTEYGLEKMQKTYYVVDDFNELYHILQSGLDAGIFTDNVIR